MTGRRSSLDSPTSSDGSLSAARNGGSNATGDRDPDRRARDLGRYETILESLEPVDLGAIAEECWRSVGTADATVRAEATATVRADRSRLKQVLENLLRNAVSHGGADVTVTVGDLDGGFYVADAGPGLPEDERGEVFEAGHTTDSNGTGFGLAIVERVGEAHGWAVRVTDGPDGGARSEFTGVGIE
ncbi:HAMP domain-containing sensor histidine kinase [Halorubrum ezzemoulense]|uniref:sensor histidine kinase n=1 Tax=Halorubrum ezzemoulense TaxID=337243 RepID=UPI00232BD8DE|nr:HAMP domain-containing sensor histidine kinase [Halorubrum ezzemoulense]MDB9301702.1 HAMP domain-containing sensor histidine kinase [Halorubrum ezzemoulense]